MDPTLFNSLCVAAAALVLFLLYRRFRSRKQPTLSRIRLSDFPPSLAGKVREAYPHLDDAQVQYVLQGLRAFFEISGQAKGKLVSMPSKIVDTAWHEFICHTKAYGQFCKRSFGRYLHHTPNEAMASTTMAHDGIKRAWALSCKREGIDPRYPAVLPILFAMDGKLGIAGGYRYSLDCGKPGYTDTYCAAHLGEGMHGDWTGGDSSTDSSSANSTSGNRHSSSSHDHDSDRGRAGEASSDSGSDSGSSDSGGSSCGSGCGGGGGD